MSQTPETGIPSAALKGIEGGLPAADERRRSRRLKVRIPLLLEWGGRREPSWTVTANDAGALVTSPQPIETGQRVTVLNVTTGRTAVARVVAPLLPDAERPSSASASGFRLALRLETFGSDFWGPVYLSAQPDQS